MNSGRKDKPSTLLVITDGKPSFKFETWQKAKETKGKGVKVVMVVLNDGLGKEDRQFMKALASGPDDSNVVMIPGVKTLKQQMDKWVMKSLVQSCPRAESSCEEGMGDSNKGYSKEREGQWCGDKKELHEYIGFATDIGACYGLAMEHEATYFTFSTDTGASMNTGRCYKELTTDGLKCPEGWEEVPVDYYMVAADMGPAGDGEDDTPGYSIDNKCRCKETWKYPKFYADDDALKDACTQEQNYCPQQPCDGDGLGSWCVVEDPACDGAKKYDGTRDGGSGEISYAYCTPDPPKEGPPCR